MRACSSGAAAAQVAREQCSERGRGQSTAHRLLPCTFLQWIIPPCALGSGGGRRRRAALKWPGYTRHTHHFASAAVKNGNGNKFGFGRWLIPSEIGKGY